MWRLRVYVLREKKINSMLLQVSLASRLASKQAIERAGKLTSWVTKIHNSG